jgi:hypothetical protein
MSEDLDPAVEHVVFVVDEDGVPTCAYDLDLIDSEGAALAAKLAAVCDDEEAVYEICHATLGRVGIEIFGYITTNALTSLALYFLNPALNGCAANGKDLRAGIQAIAREEPIPGIGLNTDQ